jgi:membrane-associated phospholipid phosphatase
MRKLHNHFLPHPAFWWVAVLIFLANTAWIFFSQRLSIDSIFATRSCAAIAAAVALVLVRLWRDKIFDTLLHRVWTLAMVGSLGMLLSVNFNVLNHLTMSLSFPLADAWLQNLDTYLPLNWLSYSKYLTDSVWTRQGLMFSYTVVSTYGLYVFMLYSIATGNRIELLELCFLLISTTLVCLLIAAAFPARAAFDLLADEELKNRLPKGAGVYHITQLMELRDAALVRLKQTELQGLATFPSFHTVLGLLIIWAGRFNPYVFVVSLITGLIVVASTPIFGGHYFVDLIAGSIVMVAAVTIWRRWLNRPAIKWVEQTDELWRAKP